MLPLGALREFLGGGTCREEPAAHGRRAGHVGRLWFGGGSEDQGSAKAVLATAIRTVLGWRSLARMTAPRSRPGDSRRVQGAFGSTKRQRARSGQMSCSG